MYDVFGLEHKSSTKIHFEEIDFDKQLVLCYTEYHNKDGDILYLDKEGDGLFAWRTIPYGIKCFDEIVKEDIFDCLSDGIYKVVDKSHFIE